MAAPTGIASQLGVKKESVYGTPVVVDRFYEYVPPESFTMNQERIRSNAIRTGTRTHRSDRVALGRKVVSGSFTVEVHNKGFGFFLEHMLGTVATSGPVSGIYTHIGTEGDLDTFFTSQFGLPATSGTVHPKTIHGTKINAWTLACDNQGLLLATFDCVGEDLEHTTALAVASYTAGTELLAFTKGTVTMGGSALAVTNISLRGELNLKTDRWHLDGDALVKEPLESGKRAYTGTMTMEFESLTEYNRYVSGTPAELIAVFTDSAGTSHLKVTAPKTHYNGDTPQVTGLEVLTQTLPFTIEYDGTNSPVTLEYKSADATP